MALAPLEAPSQSQGVPPAPRHVLGAAPSAAKAAYNTAGEGIWEQTGLGEKAAFFPLTGLLGFQPNLSAAAGEGWRVPCPPPGRGSRWGQPGPGVSPSQFMLGLELQLVHPGVALPQTGTALGHAGKHWWGAMAAAPPATGMWLCPLMVTPVGDTGPLLPHRRCSREPGTTGTRPATLTPCRWQLGKSKPQFTAMLGRRA